MFLCGARVPSRADLLPRVYRIGKRKMLKVEWEDGCAPWVPPLQSHGTTEGDKGHPAALRGRAPASCHRQKWGCCTACRSAPLKWEQEVRREPPRGVGMAEQWHDTLQP